MAANTPIDALMATTRPYLAEGGLETSMIFHEGLDLPHFSAMALLDHEEGREALRRSFDRYAGLAARAGTGHVMETVTWRGGTAWADALGWGAGEMAARNRAAVAFARETARRPAGDGVPIVLSAPVGPAGDGYQAGQLLTADEARVLHAEQVQALAEAGVDVVTALTMTHAGEAAGIARAAQAAGVPCIVSLTLETDGRLPTGQELGDAIAEIDAATGSAPLFYMVHCAHPDHFAAVLAEGGAWRERLGGLRANASRLSHAELDAAETLDEGDPKEFGALYRALSAHLPTLRIVGGCCGTDHRHVACVADELLAVPAA